MKDRKKRALVIGILCGLLVFMGVGFAVMNATLNINGTATAINTWDVRMTKIEVLKKSAGATNSEETKINEDGVTAIFKTDFTKPGDYITYEVTVENNGSIDAVLNDISITLNVAEADKELFNITDTRPNNQLLESGTSTTFTLNVEFKPSAGRMPSGDLEYTIKVDYSQQTDEVTEGEQEYEDWLYKIDESGTIIAYNYDTKLVDDPSVAVVPATIDGIPVKTINGASFKKNNVMLYSTDSGFMYAVIYEQEPNFTYVKNKAIQIIFECSSDDDECLATLKDSLNVCTEQNNCYDLDGNFTGLLPDGLSYQGAASINPDPALSLEESINGKTQITHLDLSKAVYLETIDDYSFYSDYEEDSIRIEEVIFPINGNLKTIGDQAFFESNLTEVNIPASVEFIGNLAFKHDNRVETRKIQTLTFDENGNLRIIGDYAFTDNSITSIVIPSSVTTIGKGAFMSQKDSSFNATLQSVTVKRTQQDFLANVTVDGAWFDNSLISAPIFQ